VISISPFKFTAHQARMAVAAAVLLGSAAADASEFYAYYTRLGFADAPEATLPGRTLTGKYADVIVRLPAGRFVFSREHSYLPYWEVDASKSLVPEIVARSGDVPSDRQAGPAQWLFQGSPAESKLLAAACDLLLEKGNHVIGIRTAMHGARAHHGR
jgi:hypothetical protein